MISQRTRRQLHRASLASGLFIGAASWYADQQLVISRAFSRCTEDISAYAITVGLICCGAALASLVLTSRALHAAPADIDINATNRFIGFMSIAMATIAVLGIIFATAAVFYLRCQR